MSRFNRIIIPVILGLGLVIAVLSVASARFGPTVDNLTLAHTLDGVSVNTLIGISFTEAMDTASVDHGLSIRPSIPGTTRWVGHELILTPRRPLDFSQTYTIRLGASAHDSAGRNLFRPYTTTFTTQSRHLIYLGTNGSERNRLVLASTNGRRQVVAQAGGPITEYSLSFDRSLAVYVARGSPSERPDEIWLLSLQDNSTQMVFRRPNWSLSQPHFSPDGKYIVFLATNVRLCQKYYGCYLDRSGPVIYLLDTHSRQVAPFRSTSDVPITNFIDFSPSNQLAFTDLGSALTLASPDGKQVIHIPNRGNSLEYAGFSSQGDQAAFVGQTPDSTGGDILVYKKGDYSDISHGVYDSSTPSFSPSGKQVAYSAYRTEWRIEPVYGINVYNEATRKTTRLTSEKAWSDWTPQWSVDGRYIAFIRSQPREAMYMGSGQIWIVPSAGGAAIPLGDSGQDVHWVG